MKKIVALFLGIILLLSQLVACNAGGVSQNTPDIDEIDAAYNILGEPLELKCDEDVRFLYDSLADLAFTFRIKATHYDYLVRFTKNLEFSASSSIGGVGGLPAFCIDRGESDGERIFEVTVGGVFAEDYMKTITTTLEISFTDSNGKDIVEKVESREATVYDVAYLEYVDRSDDEREGYRNYTGTDFSPYEDLSTRYAVLSSRICIKKALSVVTDMYESDVYKSLYKLEYFDGVLTVSTKNGTDLNANILKEIIINGEELYYEIHDGIIRAVLEVKY